MRLMRVLGRLPVGPAPTGIGEKPNACCRNQLREESIRRFGLRLRVGYRLFLVLVATVIGVGDRVRGQYRLENARSVRAWLQSGVNGGGR